MVELKMKHLELMQNEATQKLVLSKEHFLKGNYHYSSAAIEYSKFVFVENGFTKVSQKSRSRKLRILEMGFGSGLNAILTYERNLNAKIPVYYATVDLNPVPLKVIGKLKYDQYLDNSVYQKFFLMHSSPWFSNTCIDNGDKSKSCFFELYKIQSDILQLDFDDTFDLVYYDAFSPQLQPELWTYEILFKIYNACNVGALLVAHCCDDSVMDTLTNVGFGIEIIFDEKSKNKMIRAIK
jgi:tRNA U34 5-methylaminomethyl-2-thiouridine-forming methyltransferase MnmC